jgi:hypothetical protein
MSFKGVNYGKMSRDHNSLTLLNLTKSVPIFSINYRNISNSIINRNDIIIETNATDVGHEDCMSEIRFYVDEPDIEQKGN